MPIYSEIPGYAGKMEIPVKWGVPDNHISFLTAIMDVKYNTVLSFCGEVDPEGAGIYSYRWISL